MTKKKLLAITLGDPAGVGPEIVVKTFMKENLSDLCNAFIIGSFTVVEEAAKILDCKLPLNRISSISELDFAKPNINILDEWEFSLENFAKSCVNEKCGKLSVQYIIKAIELAKENLIDGIITAPINKEAIGLAGYDYIGHTEIFADLTGVANPVTMLKTKDLSVVHVTRHVPLKDVPKNITKENVLEIIELTYKGFAGYGFTEMRMAVAGLNPHNGDGGLIGSEEIDHIGPAVEEAKGKGFDVEGPIPADIVFHRAINGEFDIVVAMYHDQGHIPIKTHGFEESITLTLGIPMLRTSVDHGTAFDIAWKGIADHKSMIEAIRYAVLLLEAENKTN